jgi:AraC family transcriptional regulator of adaptative response / DNA-3-methyladenine glycosylase II
MPDDDVRKSPVRRPRRLYAARVEIDTDRFYRALRSRDGRFDGRFFVGVMTTGVYCRPVCPAPTPTPKQRNVRFFPCAAAAEEAGFRPCLRCRPETAPGTPAWAGSSATVSRALRLIAQGALDEGDSERLAARLGLGSRHLRRLFQTHLGASPAAVARTRRTHFARRLIDQTDRPMTDVAFFAGFRSVRQFNYAIRETFHRSPSELRRAARPPASAAGGLELCLPYRAPLDWLSLVRFLGAEATPQVEFVDETVYRRSLAVNGSVGALEVRPVPGQPQLVLRLWLPEPLDLFRVVERVRRVFDLGADPLLIASQLQADRSLARHLEARPGLRIPGAWDPFELVLRALAGPRHLARLALCFGQPVEAAGFEGVSRVFPTPEAIAEADLVRAGLSPLRAEAVRAAAIRVASGPLAPSASADAEDVVRELEAFPGIGAVAAQWIAMRGFGETDAFPARDRILQRAFGRIGSEKLLRHSRVWRPWRAYAAVALLSSARWPRAEA